MGTVCRLGIHFLNHLFKFNWNKRSEMGLKDTLNSLLIYSTLDDDPVPPTPIVWCVLVFVLFQWKTKASYLLVVRSSVAVTRTMKLHCRTTSLFATFIHRSVFSYWTYSNHSTQPSFPYSLVVCGFLLPNQKSIFLFLKSFFLHYT